MPPSLPALSHHPGSILHAGCHTKHSQSQGLLVAGSAHARAGNDHSPGSDELTAAQLTPDTGCELTGNHCLQCKPRLFCRCLYTNGTKEQWGRNSCFNLQTKLVQQTCRESEHHEFSQLCQKEEKKQKKDCKKEHKKERLTLLVQEPFQLEHLQHCWHQAGQGPTNSCCFQRPYT